MSSLSAFVVAAAGGKAFSAGGDIRALYDLGLAGRHADMLPFWREEYVLNAFIKRYPKPYVSLIDGICMGGGLALLAPTAYRHIVAASAFYPAMPWPDYAPDWARYRGKEAMVPFVPTASKPLYCDACWASKRPPRS